MNKAVLKFFNVTQSEIKPVSLLLLLSFTVGASIAFFYTATTSLLISDFGGMILPYAYVVAGFISYILWIAYSYAEKLFDTKKLNIIGFIFLIITTFLLYEVHSVTGSKWISFILYSWVRVIIFVSIVGFWNTASGLFDIQQGKRLFGLIASGEVISDIIGYFSIPLLLNVVKTNHLMLFAILGLCVSLIPLIIINRTYAKQLSLKVTMAVDGLKQKKGMLLFSTKYYRRMYLIAFLPMIGLCITDYLFLNVASHEFPEKEILTGFLGVFFGIISIIELLLKTFLSGRIISKYGITTGLQILPLSILVIIILIILLNLAGGSSVFIFTFILLARLLEKSIRSGINDPAYQLLYQPINPKERAGIQSRIEGVPKPLGLVVSGLILLVFTFFNISSVLSISMIFALILGLWLYFSRDLIKTYRDKIKTMLRNQSENVHEDIKKLFLKQLNFKESIILERLGPYRNDIIENIKDVEIIRQYIKFTNHHELYQEYNIDSDYNKYLKNITFDTFQSLLKSENENDRLFAAFLVSIYPKFYSYDNIKLLLADKNKNVYRLAVITLGKLKKDELYLYLQQNLIRDEDKHLSKNAIINTGELNLKKLDSLFRTTFNRDLQLSILDIFAEIKTPKSVKLITSKLNYPDKVIRYYTIEKLFQIKYTVNSNEKSVLISYLEEVIETILWYIATLTDTEQFVDKELYKALNDELKRKYDLLFMILSIIYEHKTVNYLKEILMGSKDYDKSFALELIDISFEEKIKELIVPLLGSDSYAKSLENFRYTYPQQSMSAEERLMNILNRDITIVPVWIKVNALLVFYEYNKEESVAYLKANVNSSDLLIQETAAYLLYKMDANLFKTIVSHYLRYPNEESEKLKITSERFFYKGFAESQLMINVIMTLKTHAFFLNVDEAHLTMLLKQQRSDIKSNDIIDDGFYFIIKGTFAVYNDNRKENLYSNNEIIFLKQNTRLNIINNDNLVLLKVPESLVNIIVREDIEKIDYIKIVRYQE
ncbi:MAG: hypothetical protein A2X02_03280 [Bacteroidetes bacterium GWF2_29_10]|nr:MAG: hypothetical protein A2X02_03280 [Bacteroidetes bacterium GWF2_29_10]